MTRRVLGWTGLLALLVVLASSLLLLRRSVAVDVTAAVAAGRLPHIRPDYGGAVIPPNIAPLNFLVKEPGSAYAVRIHSAKGNAIEVSSRSPSIVIPQKPWHKLLSANRGGQLSVDVYVRGANGAWSRFDPLVNTIADAEIDNYLLYRLIKPIYIVRVHVNIYQRDVRNYEETVVVSNQSFEGGCVNCHTLAPNHPDRMIVHSRDTGEKAYLSGMVVVRDGKVIKVDTRELVRDPQSARGRVTKALAAYASWHPNGQLAAFSANDISQFFHDFGFNRDVFDSESDLALYHADSNTVTTTPEISRPERLETFPTWSPDGQYLYFCSTDPRPIGRHEEVRYDLMRISYEPQSGKWGQVEPLLRAEETGLSMTEPRVSPDGRWLLFCASDYGSFPAYRPSSDLYLLDLQSRQYHPLAINSPRCESWHSWSSNSRWIAFASKRRDGVFARIYFSYIDEQGRAHKPVLLPQKDPTFYDRFIRTYNVPELSRTPAPARGLAISQVIRKPPATAP